MMKEAEVRSRFETIWVTIVLGCIILAGIIWLVVWTLTEKASNADIRSLTATHASDIGAISTKIDGIVIDSARLQNNEDRIDALFRHLGLECVHREGGGIEIIKRRGRWQ